MLPYGKEGEARGYLYYLMNRQIDCCLAESVTDDKFLSIRNSRAYFYFIQFGYNVQKKNKILRTQTQRDRDIRKCYILVLLNLICNSLISNLFCFIITFMISVIHVFNYVLILLLLTWKEKKTCWYLFLICFIARLLLWFSLVDLASSWSLILLHTFLYTFTFDFVFSQFMFIYTWFMSIYCQ